MKAEKNQPFIVLGITLILFAYGLMHFYNSDYKALFNAEIDDYISFAFFLITIALLISGIIALIEKAGGKLKHVSWRFMAMWLIMNCLNFRVWCLWFISMQ